jgi:hypothetical protein
VVEPWLKGVAAQLVAQPLGCVLTMGARGVDLLESLPRGAAQRIILTEADPVQVQILQRLYDGNPAVTIVPAAITRATGPVKLHRFNLTQAAALRPASGLKTLFPGLLETGQIDVQTQTVEAVVQMSDLDSGGEHVLILGVAGEEMAVIDALIALEALQRFDHVIVPLPSLPLYAESADGPAIRTRLEAFGFSITSQDLSDPNLPFVYMRLNRDRLTLIDERQRFAEAKAAAETRITQIESERDAAETGRHRAEQDIAALRETLEMIQQDSAILKNTLKEAEGNALAERDQRQRIQILGDTYRHAIRLELREPKGPSGALRTKFPVALKLLADLDDLPAADAKVFLTAPAFNMGVFKKATDKAAEHAQSHIVLDVKSVPRSGLHYMKRQFSRILQDGYSFCEWYQEPGCCKRMPCVHASLIKGGNGGSLRMLKSHDFDTTDPVYPVTPGMQRLILTRDPIFILTSHWLLSLLGRNQDLLKTNDIQTEKIYYLHEPAVLARAYHLLDTAQNIPGEEGIAAWLKQQQDYLLAFSEKWGGAAARMSRTYIVPYEKTPFAIEQCLAPIRNALSAEQRAILETHVAQWQEGFRPRSDPFKGPTPYLTTLLQRHASLFHDAAEIVRNADMGGLFGATDKLET